MQRRIISPEQFKEIFLRIAAKYEEKMLSLWKGHDPDFTLRALGNESSAGLFPEIAQSLNLNYYREYWTLDAIFYERKDTKHFTSPVSAYVEYISIALEHENNIDSSYEEINKLSIFNAPLKILVTYPKEDRGRENQIQKYLLGYSEILKNADIFDDFSNFRKHLVIFGMLNANKKLIWNFYVYNKQGDFTLLP